MKKVFLVSALFLLMGLFVPSRVGAVACCPDTGTSQYKYTYDAATNKCRITGPQGTISVDTNCKSPQTCNATTGQCEVYQEPEIPSGCSTGSEGRVFCVNTPYNYTIYCSTQAECDQYKTSLENFYPSLNPKEASSAPVCKTARGEDGIDTAIGCIPISDTNAFIGFILRWAIGVGGGIAFLLIVYSAFMIMTSQGNPERLKAGQELLTSAIAGLIMLIFSVFILNIIGVNILGIFKQ